VRSRGKKEKVNLPRERAGSLKRRQHVQSPRRGEEEDSGHRKDQLREGNCLLMWEGRLRLQRFRDSRGMVMARINLMARVTK